MSDDIQVGIYKARAVQGSEQYTQDKNGNLLLGIDMQIEGGSAEGAMMTTTLSFADKAAPYSMKKLRILGWQGTDVSDLTGVDTNAVDVRVFDDLYTDNAGQTKTRRKMEIVYGGGSFKFQNQCSDREKKAFAAQLKAVALSTLPAGQPTPQSAVGNGRPRF